MAEDDRLLPPADRIQPLDTLPVPDWAEAEGLARQVLSWLTENVLTAAVAWQVIIAGAAWLVATVIAKLLRHPAERLVVRLKRIRPLQRLAWTLTKQLRLLVFVVLISFAGRAVVVFAPLDYARALGVLSSLLTAWIIIRVATSILRTRLARRGVSAVVWTVAALDITGLYGAAVTVLDAIAIQAGEFRLSALLFVQATLWLGVLLWAATLLVKVVDRRLQSVADLSPSARVLIGKLLRFGLVALAVVMALTAVGVDMTALAVFSGALGLGIGIGLQRVVANLLSGVFLLMDRSVKPGDVIEVEGTFGWVVSMQARFVSLVTRDRKEILIPNEDFITNRVVNWSHTDNYVRLEVSFSVTYDADPHRVRALAVEAAGKPGRVVERPAPVCHLTAFGDDGLEFILRFWIEDAPGGVVNVTGQVLLAVWDAFKAEGIQVPYPHRDIKLREPVRVVMEPAATAGTQHGS
ncbi:mechanosensitive ion channel family protein [Caenispirillum salinarum]|uniref:mechanosensitive ion channel family protein n=1 Tax=Caenispirillum salinarum TaxID=859058 RepID=UPI00384BCFF1